MLNPVIYTPSGITGGYGGDRRVEFIIPPEGREKGSYSFVIEQTCNGMFGVPWSGDTIDPPDMNRYYTVCIRCNSLTPLLLKHYAS